MSNVVPSIDTGPSAKRIVGVVAVIVAAFLILMVFFSGNGSRDDDAPSVSAMTTEARAQCREAVKDRLKAPATAKFSDEKVTGSDPDAVWSVSGAVDSQNGFGALIRSSFECSVTFNDGEAQTVRVISLA